MHILLFILYAAVLGWILIRRPFFRDIRPGMLIALFALHVAAGCLHNWVAYKYYPNHGDLWVFFQDSFVARRLLLTDLHAFWAYNWADTSSLGYLPHNIIEWTHILLNYLSFDNFYINTLFFSFLTFGGHIALFRVFYARFRQDALSAGSMLLLPSILFWTSCMHTEGIIYPILGWLFYTMHRGFKEGWTLSLVARSGLLTALAIFFRPAIAIGLLPALALWTAAELQVRRRTLLITSVTLVVLVTGLSILAPRTLTVLPGMLSHRQQEYQSLVGGSRIPLPALQPTWTSLLEVFPHALFNGFFQPLPGVGGQKVYYFFALELLAIWALAALAIFTLLFRSTIHSPLPRSVSTPSKPIRPFSFACLLLPLLGMLLIGYIIPFAGAIVRYRSIYLPFLLAPCLAAFRSFPFYQKINNALISLIIKKTSPLNPNH